MLADRYNQQNPTVFTNPENAFFISYAIMMLNTDAYNPNLEDKARMTLTQFINMTRTPETENDPGASEEACAAIFMRIKSKEIKLLGGEGLILKPQLDTYSSDWADATGADGQLVLGHVVIKSLYQVEAPSFLHLHRFHVTAERAIVVVATFTPGFVRNFWMRCPDVLS
eukprot:COSAG05_NODE_497_length_9246_cov_6.935343_5_plen_169_part_00